MKSRHGTPEEFEESVANAIGEISLDEANRAVRRYREEWLAAPSIAEVPSQ